MSKLNMHKVRIIPQVTTKEVDGKKEKVYTYQRTSKPSDKAKNNGYKPDKFYHLELTEVSNFKLGGNPKPFTQNIFKTTHPVLFAAITEELENDNFTELSDKVRVLNEQMPGRIAERETPDYYGTEIDANGAEQIRMIPVKQKTGDFVKEPMIVSTLKFFLFEHEATSEDGEDVAFVKEFKRRKNWLVKPNSEENEDKTPASAEPGADNAPEEGDTEAE